MSYSEHRSSPAIAHLVEGYWTLSQSGAGGWSPIYPDGCPELVFNLAAPAEERRRGAVVRQPRHLVYGQLDQRLELRSAPDARVVAVRLRPWAVRALLDVPARSLAGRPVALDAVSPALARRLVPVVEAGAPLAATVARLDVALTAWVRSASRKAPATARVARYLLETPGSGVGDVVRLTGWSPRTAQRRFGADVGLTPKGFARVARFVRFMGLLEVEPATPLAELAVAAGYYDQPHLHRDLRRFAGTTPVHFRTRAASAFDGLYRRERLAALVAL